MSNTSHNMNPPTLTRVPTCPICDGGCLQGYDRTSGSELAAAAAWGEIVETAFEEPRLAVLLGAAAMGGFSSTIGANAVTVHACDARGDAESIIRIATSVVGDPDVLTHSWLDDPAELDHRANAVGSRPVGLVGNPTAAFLANSSTHSATVISAGLQPVLHPDVLTLMGPVMARIEVPLLHELAVRHAGWPAKWIKAAARHRSTTEWADLTSRVLSDKAAHIREAERQRLMACAVGFGLIADSVGRGFGFYAGIGAALRVSADACDSSLTLA